MSRKRTSLDAIMSQVVRDPQPSAAPMAKPVGRQGKEAPVNVVAAPGITKHTAYLKTPVYEQLRRLAFEERRKMHDYLIEGLDHVFRARGLPGVAELDKEIP